MTERKWPRVLKFTREDGKELVTYDYDLPEGYRIGKGLTASDPDCLKFVFQNVWSIAHEHRHMEVAKVIIVPDPVMARFRAVADQVGENGLTGDVT